MSDKQVAYSFETNGMLIEPHSPEKNPVAYIVTSNRGKEYLVFAGSIEHQNAAMFGYKMRALYE